MNEALALTFAALVPFLLLGLVLWMARLEETLTDGLEPVKVAPEQVPTAVPAAVSVPIAAAAEPTGVVAA